MCEVHRKVISSSAVSVSRHQLILPPHPQLSTKRETCGDKSRQLRDAQQDARDKVEVKKCFLALHKRVINHLLGRSTA